MVRKSGRRNLAFIPLGEGLALYLTSRQTVRCVYSITALWYFHPELHNLVAAPEGMLDINIIVLNYHLTMWNAVDVHFVSCVKQKCKSASHESYYRYYFFSLGSTVLLVTASFSNMNNR